MGRDSVQCVGLGGADVQKFLGNIVAERRLFGDIGMNPTPGYLRLSP